MSGSGISWDICKSATRSRQITTPAPHHSVFNKPDALPAAQPTASKHWRYHQDKMWLLPALGSCQLPAASMVSEARRPCIRRRPQTLQLLMSACTRPLQYRRHSTAKTVQHRQPTVSELSLPLTSSNPSHRSLPFLLQDWLHGFPGLFTDTSQHTRFYF